MAGGNYSDVEDIGQDIGYIEHLNIDNQHHAQQGSNDYNRVQRGHHGDYIEKTSANQHPHR